MKTSTLRATFLASLAAAFGLAHAGDPLVLDDDVPALVTPTLDSRARYEYADFHNGLDVAHAFTLRNRVGLLTKSFGGIQAFAEYEGTLVADRGAYNPANGSVIPAPARAVIADPESHELNQAWLSYSDPSGIFSVKGGRQAINLDGQRFVGGVAWRQNMQTFDAATVKWNPTSDIEVFYGFVWQVNRIFGSTNLNPVLADFGGNSHLVNVKIKNTPLGALTTYVYSLDLGSDTGNDVFSTNTIGAFLTGEVADGIKYYAEYAYQMDAFENPRNYTASYAHGSLSASLIDGVTTTVGLEYLGSDNGFGFQTPLGTNHKFNGFADRFLVTPGTGLSDLYFTAATTLPFEIKAAATYHHFWDDGFDVNIADEIDLVMSKSLGNGLTVLGKAAWFFGDTLNDTTRISMEMNYKF
ncbi:MAG: alginate export family protein [Verrucomicrobiota bacterium]